MWIFNHKYHHILLKFSQTLIRVSVMKETQIFINMNLCIQGIDTAQNYIPFKITTEENTMPPEQDSEGGNMNSNCWTLRQIKGLYILMRTVIPERL